MRLSRRTFARFLGVNAGVVELLSDDIADLTIPEGAWGVQIFRRYTLHSGQDVGNPVVGGSGDCDVKRFVFGSKLVQHVDCLPFAETSVGRVTLRHGDVFVRVHTTTSSDGTQELLGTAGRSTSYCE